MFKPSKALEEQIAKIPSSPGCYIYRNSSGIVLYVGTAINLLKRVKSYFQRFDDLELRKKQMVKQINSMEYIVADNATEAFVLETNLIRKYKPKYNVDKKDDKNYSWVMIDEKSDFPRITIVRDRKNKKAFYQGPYAKQFPIRNTLESLRKLFPYRSCARVIEYRDKKVHSSDTEPCLYWHLGLCDAPCTGKVSGKEYKKNIWRIKSFFSENRKDMVGALKEEMFELSGRGDFEKAAKIRDKIADLTYLKTRVDIEESTDEFKFRKAKINLHNRALEDFLDTIKELNLKNRDGFKIECYDISNIQGAYSVGSMVVFVNGQPDKSKYRKFRIKNTSTPDDFLMHNEVQVRRFKKYLSKSEDDSFGVLPDLIIIDGGKGQLTSALRAQKETGVTVPVIGLAKRNEEIFFVKEQNGKTNEFINKRFIRNSQAKYLVQRIRDESHRFAITYHKKLREIESKLSVLDDIPGIGRIIKFKLIKAFGNVDNIMKATDSELQQIVKNKATVKKIKDML